MIYDGRVCALAQELGITPRSLWRSGLHLKPDMPLEAMRLIANRKQGSGKSAAVKRRAGELHAEDREKRRRSERYGRQLDGK